MRIRRTGTVFFIANIRVIPSILSIMKRFVIAASVAIAALALSSCCCLF